MNGGEDLILKFQSCPSSIRLERSDLMQAGSGRKRGVIVVMGWVLATVVHTHTNAHLSITPIYTHSTFLHDERRRSEHAITGHNRARRTVGNPTATTQGNHTYTSLFDTNEPRYRTVRSDFHGC